MIVGLSLGSASPLRAAVVTAAWDANSEPDIAGYVLSYGTAPGIHDQTIDVGNITSRQLTLNPGWYYFVVQAYNTVGLVSPPSVEVAFEVLPPATNPFVRLDGPADGSTVGTSFVVSGWAIDQKAVSGSGVDAVHVYVFPSGSGTAVFGAAAVYGSPRPDIGGLFGSQFTNSGFAVTASGIAPGSYQVNAYGHSTVTGAFSMTAITNVTVSAPQSQPALFMDGPPVNGTVGQTVTVAGWAIDRGAPTGTGVDTVHVYAYPSSGGAQFLGVATYGIARSDIGAVFGSQFTNSGYRLSVSVTPGVYMFVAFAHSTVANAFNASVSAPNVTVQASVSNATLLVDAPAQNTTKTRPFTVSGWAVDSGAPTGTGISTVHVWAFPTNGSPSKFVGVATYGQARPDIGTLYGNSRFNNSGYTFTVNSTNLAAGTYDVIVFGRSTVTNDFTVSRVVRVTVQ